jgi:predicted nucleotidyltransferase
MKRLNDKIFDKEGTIIPIVREKLLTIAKKITNEVATLVEIQNIFFTGSLATYRWTATSDIDVHIIVKVLESHRDETLKEYFDLICKLFNSHHNIFIKGYKVEVNMKEEEVIHKDKAVYDLIKNKWLVEPNPKTRSLNDPEVLKLTNDIQKRIDRIVSKNDASEEGKELKKEIKALRSKGLSGEEGEYSVENLVFKKLRNTDYLTKLFNYLNELEDKKLSLESFKKYVSISS